MPLYGYNPQEDPTSPAFKGTVPSKDDGNSLIGKFIQRLNKPALFAALTFGAGLGAAFTERNPSEERRTIGGVTGATQYAALAGRVDAFVQADSEGRTSAVCENYGQVAVSDAIARPATVCDRQNAGRLARDMINAASISARDFVTLRGKFMATRTAHDIRRDEIGWLKDVRPGRDRLYQARQERAQEVRNGAYDRYSSLVNDEDDKAKKISVKTSDAWGDKCALGFLLSFAFGAAAFYGTRRTLKRANTTKKRDAQASREEAAKPKAPSLPAPASRESRQPVTHTLDNGYKIRALGGDDVRYLAAVEETLDDMTYRHWLDEGRLPREVVREGARLIRESREVQQRVAIFNPEGERVDSLPFFCKVYDRDAPDNMGAAVLVPKDKGLERVPYEIYRSRLENILETPAAPVLTAGAKSPAKALTGANDGVPVAIEAGQMAGPIVVSRPKR